jgi:hypothetical protein
MGYNTIASVATGDVLTATTFNNLIGNADMGNPVFATEAARAAAITAPTEGQRAYITGSSETTATGSVTAIPSGIQTIYNGAGWVTVTPVGAYSNTSSTATNTGYSPTATTGDTTTLSVTLRTGNSAKIEIYMNAQHSTGGGYGQISVAISAPSSLAASDPNSVMASAGGATYWLACQRSFIIVTGMVAGLNTFTLNHKTGSSTLTMANRAIVVSGQA